MLAYINKLRYCVLITAVLLVFTASAEALEGELRVTADDLKPGKAIELNGKWLYKPGYEVMPDERPEDPSTAQDHYVMVPVPQMLSRINWWLDDSEGFNKFEEKRLAALGFDTDRAEDGWYRLWIDVPEIGDKHIFIRFDGVAMKSRFYLNGKKLGEHVGMFSRFWFDLTPHLRPGKNLLAAYVSMEKLPPEIVSLGEAVSVNLTISKVVSLSKGMFGPLSPVNDNRAYDLHGIWQPVTLEVREKGRIHDSWFIPKLDSAQVKVEVSSLKGQQNAHLEADWVDASTGKLLHKTDKVPVKLSSDVQSVTLTASGLNPKLWTPEDPNLYVMTVKLTGPDGKLFDMWRQKVGFRTFEVKGNQLYLNGKRYWLRGANQLPYGKNPWDPELARKLIQLAHDGNTTVTRTHCTPWNEAWLNAADEIGLGVSIEGIRPWALLGRAPNPPEDMIEHWKMENENVIRRCRNHPSVLMWTVGNEMNLRAGNEVDKWQILSDLVKQTRAVDPTRPVICSSGFSRNKKLYEEKLKPLGVDDGDMEDLHSYRGWYGPSPFVQDSSWIKESCDYAGVRPIIGQEIATGYPNLDDGRPVQKYIDLMVPQAWVGKDGEVTGEPAAFLEHQRAVTKRVAEHLRFERKALTSGFMLFSSECWFKNSYDPAGISPYPVYEAVKFAFAPVGLALETPNRRFFAGEKFKTAVFITNDDKDIAGPLVLKADFIDSSGKTASGGGTSQLAAGIKYYETVNVPLVLDIPSVQGRSKMILRVRLMKGANEISRTEDFVEVFARDWAESPMKKLSANAVAAVGVGENLKRLLSLAPQSSTAFLDSAADISAYRVALVNGKPSLLQKEMPAIKKFVEDGGTAVILGAGTQGEKLFSEAVTRSRETLGEYVDMSDAPKELASGFEKFDFKWWGRNDGKAYVISATHNLADNSRVKALARHIVVHGYIPQERKPEFITSPLVEIPSGKGRFILCEFNLEDSVDFDPVARCFTGRLLSWAAR